MQAILLSKVRCINGLKQAQSRFLPLDGRQYSTDLKFRLPHEGQKTQFLKKNF